MAVWFSTEIECVSALSRKLRKNVLNQQGFDDSVDVLIVLFEYWMEVLSTHDLRLDAEALLTTHPPRAADALQLAAALLWCEGDTTDREFVCLDSRLRQAAKSEGVTILPEADPR